MKRAARASLSCAALLAIAAFAQVDDASWKAFLAWLDAQPPKSKPSDLLRPYRAVLIDRGMTAAEADRQMDRLGHLAFIRPDGAKILWNKVYAGDHPIFVQTPTALLASAVYGRRPGKALDIGMGQGRNSVFLASEGWEVTGFDPSSEGIRIAQASAVKAGVRIRALVTTDDAFEFGAARWDLILMTYIRSLTAADAERIRTALKPGGLFVYENGSDSDNQLLKLFLSFRIVRFEDVDAFPDWNPGAKIRLERLVAQKPPE